MSRLLTILLAMGMLATGGRDLGAAGDDDEAWVRPPEVASAPGDLVFRPEHLVHFYDPPGEYGWALEGEGYGFESISLILTDTHPGGGPPLHHHDTEEAHVLLSGTYRVLIGERRFDVTGPAIVRIPAGVAHTFVNTGDQALHLIGVLPGDSITYTELGPNPLLDTTGEMGTGTVR